MSDGIFNDDGMVYEGPTIEALTAAKEFAATVWTEEFVKAAARCPEMATDAETILCWFAGAIMSGYDRGAADTTAATT